MSAFIVDEKTIGCVVSHFYHRDSRAYVPDAIKQAMGQGEGRYIALGQALWDMNTDAVNWRYGEYSDAPVYERFSVVLASRCQTLKAIQCLLYQCSEGNVPERPLYQALREAEHELMDAIISELPEYQQARWH